MVTCEVAYITIHIGHLAPGDQGDIRVSACRDHLGGQDAGGAVQGGEGFIELSHVPADGGLSFDQIDWKPASAISSAAWIPAMPPPTTSVAGWMGTCSGSRGSCQVTRSTPPEMTAFDFFGCSDLVGMHPRDLFADGDQLAQIRVQPGTFAGCPKGRLVQVGGAGSHDHPRQPQFLDVFLDQFLTQAGAHELIIAGDDDTAVLELFSGPFGHIFYIHGSSDIGAAVAYINADFFFGMSFSCMAYSSSGIFGIGSSSLGRFFFGVSGSGGTSTPILASAAPGIHKLFANAECFQPIPKANPIIWVKYRMGSLYSS